MNDFLRLILAEPGQDAPRLVYADYLDEHGRPAKANLIRLQCRLATTKRCRHRQDRPAGCLYCRLWTAAAEQLNDPDCWDVLPELAPEGAGPDRIYRGVCFNYRRGFITSMLTSLRNWQQHADMLQATVPLELVRIVDMEQVLMFVTASCNAALPPSQRLRTVRINPRDRSWHKHALSFLHTLWPNVKFAAFNGPALPGFEGD